MNRFCAYFLRIFAAYYWAAYSLHHKFFLRPGRPLKNSRLVVIGSFRAGGAGKTPFCLWLARRLTARGKRVAILCHKAAFDEVRMYRHNLQEQIRQGLVEVHSTGNRYRAAQELDRACGKAEGKGASGWAPDFILCDDGFEDSRLRPHAIFRLDWEKAPTEIDQLLPAGKFRSLLQDHSRDQVRTTILRCHGVNPDVRFFIGSIANSEGDFPKHRQSIAVCGLGDPERFVQDLKKAELTVQKSIVRPDHDRNFQKNFHEILRKHCEKNIVISEKDSFRLSESLLGNPQTYVARQSILVNDLARARIDKVLAK